MLQYTHSEISVCALSSSFENHEEKVKKHFTVYTQNGKVLVDLGRIEVN